MELLILFKLFLIHPKYGNDLKHKEVVISMIPGLTKLILIKTVQHGITTHNYIEPLHVASRNSVVLNMFIMNP